MLSPAQPSQPSQPAFRGKKMHHFELIFSSKMFKEREIILLQNRKNKIISGANIHLERIKNAHFVFMLLYVIFHVFLQSNIKIEVSKARFPFWIHHHFLIKIYDF